MIHLLVNKNLRRLFIMLYSFYTINIINNLYIYSAVMKKSLKEFKHSTVIMLFLKKVISS